MLHKLGKDLKGRKIKARDGDIGSVEEAYFDDARWVVRYLVVDTGHWLPGRKVLISPASIAAGQPKDEMVRVELTQSQVRDAPGVDTNLPVSRQFEEAHARYYGYPFYWDGPYVWGQAQHPVGEGGPVTSVAGSNARSERVSELKDSEQQARESHLRSSEEVIGYRVVAADGPTGHVEDIVVDTDDWAIAQFIVDTRDWLPGGNVAIPPTTIKEIDWVTREVRLAVSREEVKGAPDA